MYYIYISFHFLNTCLTIGILFLLLIVCLGMHSIPISHSHKFFLSPLRSSLQRRGILLWSYSACGYSGEGLLLNSYCSICKIITLLLLLLILYYVFMLLQSSFRHEIT